jgi:hypothetical protein
MSDTKLQRAEVTVTPSEPREMNWRSILLGIGTVLLLVALGVGAGLKQAGGMAPKIIGLVAVALMAIALMANLVVFLTEKLKGAGKASAQS